MAIFPTDAIPQTTTLQPFPIITAALKQTDKQTTHQAARANQTDIFTILCTAGFKFETTNENRKTKSKTYL